MKKNLMELGRSMVEMLGVLAIIGVLSIVGIQGYKKAMLKIKVNDAWEAVEKFRAVVQERMLLYPNEVCSGDWYAMEPDKGSGYCYLDRPELLPPFTDGSTQNFRILINKPAAKGSGTIEVLDVNINGFCSSFLPDGKQASGNWWDKSRNGTLYRCRKTGSSEF